MQLQLLQHTDGGCFSWRLCGGHCRAQPGGGQALAAVAWQRVVDAGVIVGRTVPTRTARRLVRSRTSSVSTAVPGCTTCVACGMKWMSGRLLLGTCTGVVCTASTIMCLVHGRHCRLCGRHRPACRLCGRHRPAYRWLQLLLLLHCRLLDFHRCACLRLPTERWQLLRLCSQPMCHERR